MSEAQVFLDRAEEEVKNGKLEEAAKLYNQVLQTSKYKCEPFALAGLGFT